MNSELQIYIAMQNDDVIMDRTNCSDHTDKEGRLCSSCTPKRAREDSYVCFKGLLSDLLVEIGQLTVLCTVSDCMSGHLRFQQWALKVFFLQLAHRLNLWMGSTPRERENLRASLPGDISISSLLRYALRASQTALASPSFVLLRFFPGLKTIMF